MKINRSGVSAMRVVIGLIASITLVSCAGPERPAPV